MVDYEYAELFNNDSLDKQIHITASGGVDLGNDDLVSESFQLIESLCSEEYLTFGAVEPRCVRFTVKYSAPKLLNKWLTITMDLQGAETPFSFGDYQVTSDKPSSDRTTREVVAYGHFHKILQNKYKNWYKSAWGNSKTMTIKQFRDSFFARLQQTHSWVVQEEITLVNDDVVIRKAKKIPRVSGKDILNAICEINGVFGYIDREGVFRYKTLDNSDTANSISSSLTISTEYEDYSTTTIDRVEILTQNGDLLASAGATESNSNNKYVIESNFMLKGMGNNASAQITAAQLAANLLSVISNVNYIPFDADFKGNPCFEVGDRISFQSHGNTISTFLLGRRMTGIQSLRDNFYAESGDAVYPEDANTLSSSMQKIKDFAAEKSEISIGTEDPNEGYLDGQEGDMYIKETHETVKKNVTKTFQGFQTYHICVNNLTYYTLDTFHLSSNSGNFITAFIPGVVHDGGRDYKFCVINSKSMQFGAVYFVLKLPKNATIPEFTADISDFEEHNFPPPRPFQDIHLKGWGKPGETVTPFVFNGNSDTYRQLNDANTHYYYFGAIATAGTWIGGMLDEPTYTFENMTAFRNAMKADEIVIPDVYEGQESQQLKYNDGSGGSSQWKGISSVSNVSTSEEAGGTENNGLALSQSILSLKPNVVRAWYKADPPQTKRTFSQLCARYTGSPDKQVTITPYANHEWANSGVDKDDDGVYIIKCHGTYNSESLCYVVYKLTGLVQDKEYFFNFRCKFANNATFNYDMSKGLGLVFSALDTLSSDNFSGDEDTFNESTLYYAFKRNTNPWYGDFGFTAVATTMYMHVLMQNETANADVTFTMSEFVVSQKERELIRNIYLYDYHVNEWLKYKPFTGTVSGGDEGGSTVAIQPTLSQGTKIANYSIDGIPGELYAPDNEYELPIASEDTLGGIKVGANLSIDEETGVLSAQGGGASAISDLTDVDLDNLSNGQILKWNNTTEKWENADESGGGGGGATTLAGLSDVDVQTTTPTDGQVLTYDGANDKWINADASGGGAIDYSTTEQNTGQKWIDGKPIYQKVINDLTISFSTSGNVGRYASINLSNYLSNIDKLWVDFSASYYLLNSTNQRSFLYAAFSNGTTLDLFVETSRSNVPVVLVVRYTKTTD